MGPIRPFLPKLARCPSGSDNMLTASALLINEIHRRRQTGRRPRPGTARGDRPPDPGRRLPATGFKASSRSWDSPGATSWSTPSCTACTAKAEGPAQEQPRRHRLPESVARCPSAREHPRGRGPRAAGGRRVAAWRATPAGAAFNGVYVPVTHPTQPESSAKGNRAKRDAEITKIQIFRLEDRPALRHTDTPRAPSP
jgi:hypothetical protein